MRGDRARQPGTDRRRGFTLIELAIGIAVLALLVGALLVPVATRIEQRNIAEVERTFDQIKEALIGFALAQSPPRLPCPGNPNTGIELLAGANCIDQEGLLPWATIGVGASDPWGNRYRYRVSASYSQSAGFGVASVGDINVCEDVACTIRLSVTTPLNQPPAVILSHGPNGRGATSAANIAGVAPMAASSPDEIANTDANVTFISRPPRATVATAGDEFDDVVTWLSPHVLKARLFAAGKLP